MAEIKQRSEIEEGMKWRISDIYPDAEAWEADFELLRQMIAETGNLHPQADEKSVACILKAVFALYEKAEKVYCYSYMLRDEDSRETAAQAMRDRATTLIIQVQAILAGLRAELIALPEELLKACIEAPDMCAYDRFLQELLRMRTHTLSVPEEVLLAKAGEIGAAADNIYTLLTEADMKFPSITDENGETIEVSDARLPWLLSNRNQKVRREAFRSVMNTYGQYGNTMAAIYGSSVKNDLFTANARKYKTAMEASLAENEIPTSVYDALLTAVSERLPALGEYLQLKKRALGLSELHLWDLYVDTTGTCELKFTYDEAYDTMCDALAPLGEDYVSVLREAKRERWIDVEESVGKHGGAYSTGVYSVHPYVLMNFNGSLDSVSTLAHEMGHSMHTYYSSKKQPFPKADYSLFAAEVASTVNEILLNCYLLEKNPDEKTQAYLMGTLLEHFRTTVFRQTLFAEFEKCSHEMQESGEALTKDALCEKYTALYRKYYGSCCVIDPEVCNEWMRIPHFYRAFYVYQYATGFSAAACIAKKILREGKPAVEGYKKFLSAGGSLPPIEALKLAGVDMSTPEPVREALSWFEEILGKLNTFTQK